ncbi:hypothetical protein G6F56_010018 [Rhizopus delemar]|nr:hypothetical protein G6F56_010018 [Rhizopus delemar]
MDKVVTATKTISLSTVARRRMRTSREEMLILEEQYRKNPNPNQKEKDKIAERLQMGSKNVHFWFQNRRAKENKKKKSIQQQKQKKQQHLLDPPHKSSLQKQYYLRDRLNSSGNEIQSTRSISNQQMQLPPISDLMVYPIQDLSIPFYFYHSKFGIEDSLVQWTRGRENNS